MAGNCSSTCRGSVCSRSLGRGATCVHNRVFCRVTILALRHHDDIINTVKINTGLDLHIGLGPGLCLGLVARVRVRAVARIRIMPVASVRARG